MRCDKLISSSELLVNLTRKLRQEMYQIKCSVKQGNCNCCNLKHNKKQRLVPKTSAENELKYQETYLSAKVPIKTSNYFKIVEKCWSCNVGDVR
jgi:hypothetical protein